MWDALCIGIERPDLPLDPRFETDALRQENHAALYEEIAPWIAARDKHEVMRILGEVGAPCGAVLDTEELFADPHLRERGFIQKVEHPVHGELELLGWAPRLSDSDVPFAAEPLLGAHSEEVLQADLGLGDADLAELRESGVVG